MPQRVIAIAKAQIGFKENNGDNHNPFAQYLDTIEGFYNGKKDGYAWCDIFCDFCFVKAYGVETAKKMINHNDCGAGCIFSARAYRDIGRFDKTPQVGDQIFYGSVGNETHTGIVVEVNGDTVTTIEGNFGDKVGSRTIKVNDSSIAGFGHPLYWLAPTEEEIGEINDINSGSGNIAETANDVPEGTFNGFPTIQFGEEFTHWTAVLQALLWARGYPCGEIDDEFGIKTKLALMKFQKANNLAVSGICDKVTWHNLMTG